MSQLWDQGDYEGTLVSCELGESKQKGSPQIELKFSIEGHFKYVTLNLNDVSRGKDGKTNEERSFEKMRDVLGWNGEVEPEKMVFAVGDKLVKLNCRHETYNGNTKERWDLLPASFGNKPMSADRARLIADKFKKSAPRPVGRPTTPPPVSKPAGGPPSRPPVTKPPARPTVATDRNEAWEALRETLKQDPEDTAWFSTIGRVEKDTGKKEEDFGTFEWSKVVADYPPF